MPTYLFIDTMILLHFKPLSDIPWETLVSDKPIELRITHGVIRELDRHKNSHSSSKIRERARRVLRQIESWPNPPMLSEIREHVVGRIHLALPKQDLPDFDLDARWADDVLIATVLEFQRDTPQTHVLLVTDDTGARLRSRNLGLKCLSLSDDLRLPDEQDPLEAENQRLKQQISQLSAVPLPKLQIVFPNDQAFMKFGVPAPVDPTGARANVTRQMEEVRAKYARFAITQTFLVAGFPAPDEIERYKKALPTFFEAYENYLGELLEYERRRALTFEFSLQLMNVGRAPALDIDIDLHFPDGFSVSVAEALPQPPRPPDPPPSPRTALERALTPLEAIFKDPRLAPVLYSPGFIDRLGPPPNVSRPRITKSNSYHIAIDVQRLKHGFREDLAPLSIIFEDAVGAHSFEAQYVINADNMPDDATGTLHFVFDPERGHLNA